MIYSFDDLFFEKHTGPSAVEPSVILFNESQCEFSFIKYKLSTVYLRSMIVWSESFDQYDYFGLLPALARVHYIDRPNCLNYGPSGLCSVYDSGIDFAYQWARRRRENFYVGPT